MATERPTRDRRHPATKPVETKPEPVAAAEPVKPEEPKPPVNTETTSQRKNKPVDLNVTFGTVEIVEEGNPFARGSYELEPTHPVYALFVQSLDAGKPLTLSTPNPHSLVALLRKVASQRGQGVRFPAATTEAAKKFHEGYTGKITFQAMANKSKRGRPAKSSGDATPDNPTTE